ncbi:pentatricopeptide repeat-containing protein At1g11290, chloroplastic-like [Wolffia australiana]
METVLCGKPNSIPQPGSQFRRNSHTSAEQNHAQPLKSPPNLIPNSLSLSLHSLSLHPHTFPPLFKSCASPPLLPIGQQLHAHTLKRRLSADPFCAASTLNMYMKNGHPSCARKVFDGMPVRDAISWNSLIAGYSFNGMPEAALLAFLAMRIDGVTADHAVAAAAFAACAETGQLSLGKGLHCWALKSGLCGEPMAATALVDMYAAAGDTEAAKKLFWLMEEKDTVAWNCIIRWVAENCPAAEALELFMLMQEMGFKPETSTFAGLLPAVGRCGLLHQVKSCHGYLIRHCFVSDEVAATAITDAYAKSGEIAAARRVFDGMPSKGVVSWTAMVAGYGAHGLADQAIGLFQEMISGGVRPNSVSYLGVLSACVHGGRLEEGRSYFQQMSREFGIAPSIKHYTCMIDLLGRAGLLQEAMDLALAMKEEPSIQVWGALLAACKVHGNIEIGELVAEKLFQLNPADPGVYVLLSNLYASAQSWEEVGRVRKLMRDKGLTKPAGWSSVEIGPNVHTFLSDPSAE